MLSLTIRMTGKLLKLIHPSCNMKQEKCGMLPLLG